MGYTKEWKVTMILGDGVGENLDTRSSIEKIITPLTVFQTMHESE